MVLLGLLPHQVDGRRRFAEASLVVKLVHVGQRRVRGRGRYVAPEERVVGLIWRVMRSDRLLLFTDSE